jgi:hypothetical protein
MGDFTLQKLAQSKNSLSVGNGMPIPEGCVITYAKAWQRNGKHSWPTKFKLQTNASNAKSPFIQ